jgi:hypothetical protein
MRYSIEFFLIGNLPILARMMKNTDSLIKEFFNKNTLAEVTIDELAQLKDSHPYSSVLSYLYSKKLKQQDSYLFNKEVSHSKLFFNNHRWLYGQGSIETIKGDIKEIADKTYGSDSNQENNDHENELEKSTIKDVDSTNTGMEVSQQEQSVEMAFEPYHTVDYFASQGIRLGQIESADKLGQKVKSFTEWLKTMKKMQAEEEKFVSTNHEISPNNNDNQLVETIVITEAMAEIYQKQGLIDKAIEVYNKLSLQNPHNSHIFAIRIKDLKENRP